MAWTSDHCYVISRPAENPPGVPGYMMRFLPAIMRCPGPCSQPAPTPTTQKESANSKRYRKCGRVSNTPTPLRHAVSSDGIREPMSVGPPSQPAVGVPIGVESTVTETGMDTKLQLALIALIALAVASSDLSGLAGRAAEAQTPRVVSTYGTRTGVPGSEWYVVPAAGGKVKVWAQTHLPDELPKARAIAAELTNTIWPKLTGTFWEPLKDAGLRGVPNPPDTGDGPELDIYLVEYQGNEPDAVEKGGHSRSAIEGRHCGASPRYLTIETNQPLGGAGGKGLLNILAHELMHAITQAVPWRGQDCEEFRWIDEATATWAEQVVYPDSESEHARAFNYLVDTEKPLDFAYNEDDPRAYGLYLFPFDLELRGHQAAVPEMWRQFGTKGSLAGIASALGTVGQSFDKFFPQFMVDNWNRHSADLYHRKDGLTQGAPVDDDPEVVALGGGRYEKKIPLQMKYLSSSYRYFRFQREVKAVSFDNGLSGAPHAKVWAIEKLKGRWEPPRELSELHGETWCRPDEDLEELVLVFGNTDWPQTPPQEANLTSLTIRGEHTLRAYPTGCTAWAGQVSTLFTQSAPGWFATETSKVTAVRFELNPDMLIEGEPPRYWHAVSGTLQWTASLRGECQGDFGGQVPIRPYGGNEMGTMEIFDDGEAGPTGKPVLRYRFTAGPWPIEQDPKFAFRCPITELPSTLSKAYIWIGSAPEGHTFSAQGNTIVGTYAMPHLPAGSSLVWKWELHAVP